MEVIICKDYDEASAKAYEVMKGVISAKEDATLGLATGSTPIGLYKNMIKDHKEMVLVMLNAIALILMSM